MAKEFEPAWRGNGADGMKEPGIELTDSGTAWRDRARENNEQTGLVASHAFDLGFLCGLEAGLLTRGIPDKLASLKWAASEALESSSDKGSPGNRAYAVYCLNCHRRIVLNIPFAGGLVICPACGHGQIGNAIP